METKKDKSERMQQLTVTVEQTGKNGSMYLTRCKYVRDDSKAVLKSVETFYTTKRDVERMRTRKILNVGFWCLCWLVLAAIVTCVLIKFVC